MLLAVELVSVDYQQWGIPWVTLGYVCMCHVYTASSRRNVNTDAESTWSIPARANEDDDSDENRYHLSYEAQLHAEVTFTDSYPTRYMPRIASPGDSIVYASSIRDAS